MGRTAWRAPTDERGTEGSRPMLSEREVSAAIGGTAYGVNGDKIGTVEYFFVDDRTGAPTWAAVSTGLFGIRHSIVPAVDATFDEGNLRLPVSADAVKSAPHIAGDHLDPTEEAELRRHYGVEERGTPGQGVPEQSVPEQSVPEQSVPEQSVPEQSVPEQSVPEQSVPEQENRAQGFQEQAAPDPAAAPTQRIPAVPPPSAAPATAAAPTAEAPPAPASTDGAMTRSEEQLRVGTERVAATRTRLVKYVVTEEVQITVPIRREEIRVEEVPVDAPDQGPGESLVQPEPATPGMAPAGAGGLPDEIILHTERPVVSVEVVPTERVRLRTEVVQGQETVSGQVQREQIVVDQDSRASEHRPAG